VNRARAADRAATVALVAAPCLALAPLVAVLGFTVARGAHALRPDFLTHSMRGVGPLDTYGGAYHAILGTLEQVALATVVAVPLGLLAAVYLASARGPLARLASAAVDVLTGVPSIVAGLFVYAFWVLGLHRGFSGLAAAVALALLMLPVVVRSAEQVIKLVPADIAEAAHALGLRRWRVTWSVVLPAARGGIVTGVLLAVGRVTGETAPLLLTAFGNDAINASPTSGPQSALPLFVFQQAGSASRAAVDRAWAGALTLVSVVVVLTFAARLLARRWEVV
jgi:phosphate transport system permease protein